jgi:alanine dehydrogenase
MDIGIPTERLPNEYRCGQTPHGIQLLTQAGHRCYVEQGAGAGAGFTDLDFERAGARIVYGPREVWSAPMWSLVSSPMLEELSMAREDQTVCAFWHLATRPREVLSALIDRRMTAISYEMIQNDDGSLPVLRPFSEIAGRMTPQIAARLLQNDGGGNGLLISGITGIPPLDVAILGAGILGSNAARAFNGLGARVFVLDTSLEKLQEIDNHYQGRVTTMVAYDFNIARVLRFAHVVVGAVLVLGERAPVIVTREMVRSMRPRSVIIDLSIDQGGCVETSRLTTHSTPTFVEENVIHYCVPNVPGVVARTATHAFLNVAGSFIQQMARLGVQEAIDASAALHRGVPVRNGQVLDPHLAKLVLEMT